MRRMLATAAALVLTLVGAAGCSEDDPEPSTETETIEITFEGDTVTPSGERVPVKAGQAIELVVKSDAPGEIHVHSDPEQELAYSEGTTTLPLAPIDKPGVVDVESHDLEQVIVQLEVE